MVISFFLGATLALQTAISPELPARYNAPPPAATTKVATINGTPVPAKDVEALLWEWMGPKVTDEVVNFILVRQAAAKAGITITEFEVEQRMQENLKSYDEKTKGNEQVRPNGISVEQALLNQGYPPSRLYLNTEVEVTLAKLAEKLFDPTGYLKLSVMAFKPADGTPAASKDALTRATAAVAKLRAGGKWIEVLQTSGSPEQLLRVNGLLGWVDFASLPATLKAQIKPRKPGEITDPVLVENVYEVFRVEGLGAKAVGQDLDDLKHQFVQSKQREVLGGIIAAAKVERFPVQEPGVRTPPAGANKH